MLYVEDVDEKSVIIGSSSEPWRSRILRQSRPNELPITIPASKDSYGYLRVEYDGEQRLAEILSTLRDAGLPFLDVACRAAQCFESLRDRGLVSGEIETVCWAGPGKPIFDKL